MSDTEIEVWTGRRDDGRVEWHINVDGQPHGGGTAANHWTALRDASNYMRDRQNAEAARV